MALGCDSAAFSPWGSAWGYTARNVRKMGVLSHPKKEDKGRRDRRGYELVPEVKKVQSVTNLRYRFDA